MHIILDKLFRELVKKINSRNLLTSVEFIARKTCISSQRIQSLKTHSCIEIYAHSCLKLFSIGRKPCSNSKTHVQIMKFMCRLNMDFDRHHWSMRRDVMCFVLNKMADVEEAPRVSVSFYVVNVIFKRF